MRTHSAATRRYPSDDDRTGLRVYITTPPTRTIRRLHPGRTPSFPANPRSLPLSQAVRVSRRQSSPWDRRKYGSVPCWNPRWKGLSAPGPVQFEATTRSDALAVNRTLQNLCRAAQRRRRTPPRSFNSARQYLPQFPPPDPGGPRSTCVVPQPNTESPRQPLFPRSSVRMWHRPFLVVCS